MKHFWFSLLTSYIVLIHLSCHQSTTDAIERSTRALLFLYSDWPVTCWGRRWSWTGRGASWRWRSRRWSWSGWGAPARWPACTAGIPASEPAWYVINEKLSLKLWFSCNKDQYVNKYFIGYLIASVLSHTRILKLHFAFVDCFCDKWPHGWNQSRKQLDRAL